MDWFHGTFRPDFLDIAQPFITVAEAQAAVDEWVGLYNTDRPHQGLNDQVPVTPQERFKPVPEPERAFLPFGGDACHQCQQHLSRGLQPWV